MGFALFDQSDVFNPLDYGLNVGDRLEVMCVGGGGGGGTASGSNTSGGNGGPSSFGSYITALGGYGCSNGTGSTGKWRGTPTQYMTMGCTSTGVSNSNPRTYSSYGGGGGGGWWYDAPRLHAVPYIYLENQGGSSADIDHVIPVNLDMGAGTAGVNGFACSIRSGYEVYSHFSINWPSNSMWQPIIQNMSNNLVTGVFVPGIPVAGGTSWYNTNSYNSDLLPYPTHASARGGAYGTGGLGYGAGGGSYCSTYTYRPGGCGGELRRASVILSSVEPISVSVGGGGSGGCAHSSNALNYTAYNGLDGSAGAAGDASHQYGCPGGYGTSIPVPKRAINNTSEACYVGGGGAGGCVAIWW